MISLALLARKATALSQLDYMQKVNAATAMIGIIYYNQFAGRSGEWEAMQRQHVVDQIAVNANYLECHEHKAVSQCFFTGARRGKDNLVKYLEIYLLNEKPQSDCRYLRYACEVCA